MRGAKTNALSKDDIFRSKVED